jgi:hypothetical protein
MPDVIHRPPSYAAFVRPRMSTALSAALRRAKTRIRCQAGSVVMSTAKPKTALIAKKFVSAAIALIAGIGGAAPVRSAHENCSTSYDLLSLQSA